ncbi:DNA-binding transcription repressor [Coemansia sp. IMI 209127]|nr:DNA-binding transcription repressor [Coemansia sp. IMI 209127]
MAVAPARNKRKGIPMRSPCQRDMVEAPGVVFRFPDKINAPPSVSGDHINHTTSDVSAIAILPSSAGLPSGLGAKTAAAVIAAAAAVTSSSSSSADSFNNSTADNTAPAISATVSTDSGDAVDITVAAPSTADALTLSKQQQQGQDEQQQVDESVPSPDTTSSYTTTDPGKEGSDRDGAAAALESANSTPLLKPATGPSSISAGAVPIHRSASNVLHYPELLTDLRDKLIQIHQISGHGSNHNSSGIESDGNHQANAANSSVPRRSRVRRAGRGGASGAFGERDTPSRRGRPYYPSVGARRSGLRGGDSHGARVNASSPGPDSSNTLGVSEAAAAAKSSAVPFHRRHSIGTLQSQAEDDEEIDVEEDGDDEGDDDEGPLALTSATSHQYNLPVSYRHSGNNNAHYKQQQARRQHDGQVSGMAASARRHHPLGNGAAALAPGVYPPSSAAAKRKRDSKSPSAPQAKRVAHSHQPFHRHQSPAASIPASGGGGGRRSCASCGANSTPCWRPGLIDKVTLCNQCGLRYKKGKVYCSTCSYVPTKTEIATGGALECKRCMSRIVRQPQRPSSPSSSRASESPTPGL